MRGGMLDPGSAADAADSAAAAASLRCSMCDGRETPVQYVRRRLHGGIRRSAGSGGGGAASERGSEAAGSTVFTAGAELAGGAAGGLGAAGAGPPWWASSFFCRSPITLWSASTGARALIACVSIVFHMSVSKPLVRNLSTKSLPEAIKAYTEFSADMSQTKEEMRRRLQPELSSA